MSSYVSNLDELIVKFRQYDTNGNGTISVENFEKVLQKVVELNAVESKQLLKILDYDNTKFIAYKQLFEFSKG